MFYSFIHSFIHLCAQTQKKGTREVNGSRTAGPSLEFASFLYIGTYMVACDDNEF